MYKVIGGHILPQFLNITIFSNTVSDYIVFLLTVILSIIVIKAAEYFFLRRIYVWAHKTPDSINDLLLRGIKKYLVPILYISAVFLCTKILTLNPGFVKLLNTVVLFILLIIGSVFASSVVVFALNKHWKNKETSQSNYLAINLITGIIKVLIWVVALILFLDNIGVKITTLITGLGIGGVAIAFAAQSILSDFFCFFTIVLDHPFEVGDFLIVGEQMGTVEHIGMKTTRLRALGGEQLIFSNTDLTGSRINNYKTLEQRRVLFTIRVTYQTSSEKCKAIPLLIKTIVESMPGTTFSRTHFISYGTYCLNFEVAYFILSSDYDKYMDINQAVNLRIKEEFDKQGIAFAYPTQTLNMPDTSAV